MDDLETQVAEFQENYVIMAIYICITSIYQPTNAHTISYKALLKHFKTLRHVSILSDHHQGALSYDAHLATAPQHIPTQHDMLPQHLVCKYELNCKYCNISLARNKVP